MDSLEQCAKLSTGQALGLFTVGIFGPFFIPFLGHSHDSHDSHYFSLLFSFILINGGNEKVRTEEKSKEK